MGESSYHPVLDFVPGDLRPLGIAFVFVSLPGAIRCYFPPWPGKAAAVIDVRFSILPGVIRMRFRDRKESARFATVLMFSAGRIMASKCSRSYGGAVIYSRKMSTSIRLGVCVIVEFELIKLGLPRVRDQA